MPVFKNVILVLLAITSRITIAFFTVQHVKRNLLITNAVAQQTTPILPIDDIAGRWKVTKFGQDGYNAIDVADKNYCYVTEKITMKRTGGLGLDLLEYNTGKGNLGLVLVGDIIPGSNAATAGKFVVGDALTEISAGTQGQEKIERLEGLNFDSTVAVLGSFSDYETISLTVKRMAKRGEITIQMVGPDGEDAGSFACFAGYGSNLRTALQSQNMKMYDDRTYRFDSPYQQGNCGGDGTCGTCVVSVLSGANLLNERVRVEDGALKKQLAPPNYRWACRVQVAGSDPTLSGVLKIKLRPQSASW